MQEKIFTTAIVEHAGPRSNVLGRGAGDTWAHVSGDTLIELELQSVRP